MLLSLLRHSGFVVLVAASCASVACSSTPSPPPDVYIGATLGPDVENPHACAFPSIDTWLKIGTGTSGKPTTVVQGGSNGAGNVTIGCNVHPSGKGFDVSLSASLDGPQGASLTITSPSGAGLVTQSPVTGLTADFGGPNGRYSQNNCTLSFTYNQQPVPTNVGPAVAAGRIWGHVSCPAAQALGQNVSGTDGGITTATCDAEADFLFEQCGE